MTQVNVTVNSLPLPANASQESGGNLAAIAASVAGPTPAGTNVIGHVIVDSAGNVTITSLPSIPAGTNVIGHVIVDSLSGSVAITAASLPLPANAAQETGGNLAALAALITGGKLSVTDAAIEALISSGKLLVSDAALEACISASKVAVSWTDPGEGTPGSATPTTASTVAGSDGTDLRVLTTDMLGQMAVIGRPQIPTIIQKAKSSNTGAASTTLTCAFGSNVQAGNTLLAFLVVDLATSLSTFVTDTLGNNYQTVQIGVTNGLQVLCFQAIAQNAGANTLTFTLSGSHIMAAVIYEVNGLGSFEAGAANGATSTQNVRISGASGIPVTQDNCLAFMFVGSANATITNDTSAGSLQSLTSDESGTVTGGTTLVAFNCFSGQCGKTNFVNSNFINAANLAPLFEYSLSAGVASEGIVVIFRPSSVCVTGQVQGMYPSGQIIGTNAAENPVLIGALDSTSTIRTPQIETAGADGVSNAANELMVDSREALFNGSTWDRQRGNFDTSTGDSGVKAGSGNGATQTSSITQGLPSSRLSLVWLSARES